MELLSLHRSITNSTPTIKKIHEIVTILQPRKRKRSTYEDSNGVLINRHMLYLINLINKF